MWCDVCEQDAKSRCSGCKNVWYCSQACQNIAWPGHKKECKINQKLNEIQAEYEKTDRAKEAKKPAKGCCTGCNVKFTEDYRCEQDCPDCEYKTCESCACSNSRGTCYCPNSNFGYPYCDRDPAWYHGNGRTGASYRGDRHPESSYVEYPEDAWEAELRECGNCGQVKKMLKKEYC